MIQFFLYRLVFLKYNKVVEIISKVDVSFLFKFVSLSSKSVFLTKLAISFLLAKFGCVNLAVKFSAVNLLISGIVMYLS